MIRFFNILAAGAIALLLCAVCPPARFRARAASAATGQAVAPPPSQAAAHLDPTAVNAGRGTFVTNCGFCHGPDARGGALDGPDLTHSTMLIGDPTDEQLIALLKAGRPPKMPPFSLPDSQVSEIMTFLRAQILATSNGRGSDPKAILVGDARAGEVYFNGTGKCVTCHSVTGDLKGIGSKYDPQMLQGRMVLARGRGGYPGRPSRAAKEYAPDIPRTASVSQPSGQTISGELVSVSDYYVTIRDSSGTLQTFARNNGSPKVEIKDPLYAHVALLPKLTNKTMHDLTAYMVTLK